MAEEGASDDGGRTRPSLDEVDRELVLALQRDGRASYAGLARDVGLSEAAVRTRVQRLLRSGVVQVAAVADPNAFGFTITAMVGITSVGDLRELGDALAAIESVHFVALTAGRYDCLAEVVCLDNADLLALVNDRIRAVPGVTAVEVVTYLELRKQWKPDFVRAGRRTR